MAKQRARKGGFAASALTGNTECLTGRQVEGHLIHHMISPALLAEPGDVQAADAEQGLNHWRPHGPHPSQVLQRDLPRPDLSQAQAC